MRPHLIKIATAAEVAANLPFPSRRKGPGRYRTRGVCHGSAHKPDSDSLVYQDPQRPGEQYLVVYCHSCVPEPKSKKMDEIRHVLQDLTGLWLCLCPDCCAAARNGQPPSRRSAGVVGIPGRTGGRQAKTPRDARRHQRSEEAPRDTGALAAAIWQQAQPLAKSVPPHHPVNKWLAGTDGKAELWAAEAPLPNEIRWLAREQLRQLAPGRPASNATGALVLAMRRLDDNPKASPHKVHLVAIDAEGCKAQHWQHGREKRDKNTYGRDTAALGLLWRPKRRVWEVGDTLHICEGLADGLRILRYVPEPAVVAVMGGKNYRGIDPSWFSTLNLWPDRDDTDAEERAMSQAQHWVDQGHSVKIRKTKQGHDPASAPLTRI